VETIERAYERGDELGSAVFSKRRDDAAAHGIYSPLQSFFDKSWRDGWRAAVV
jgi:hypothetical protein